SDSMHCDNRVLDDQPPPPATHCHDPPRSSSSGPSLHDALPILLEWLGPVAAAMKKGNDEPVKMIRHGVDEVKSWPTPESLRPAEDRKSTRLNSSHVESSYAVSCLKKKTYCSTASG